jgi:PKD repeat protein
LTGRAAECNEAIANHSLDVPTTTGSRLRISGAFAPTNIGENDCHDGHGKMRLRTSADGWDVGSRTPLFETNLSFEMVAPDGSVVTSLNPGDWNTFEVVYERSSSSEVTLSYTVNGSSHGSVTRPVESFEGDLSYLALGSDDFTTWFDDLTVVRESSDDDDDGDDFRIQTIDPGEYPLVCTYLQVDTPAGRGGELTQDDFRILEDGVERSIDEFRVLGGGGSDAKIDIAFCFDDTGSMGDEIDAMKASVRDFADDIEAAGFDARYSLVSFKDDVELDQGFTSNVSTFKSAVDGLRAAGGRDIPEDNLDAIDRALGLSYRPDAEKVIVDITDAPTHVDGDGSGITNFTIPEIASKLRSAGVNFFAVAPPQSEVGTEETSKEALADEAGGTFIDIRSEDFGAILDEIRGDLTRGRYLVCFSTPLECEDVVRPVTCFVDDPDRDRLRATGKYVPPDFCWGGGGGPIDVCVEPGEIPVGEEREFCVTLGGFETGFAGCEFVFTLGGIVTPVDVTANDDFGVIETDITGQEVRIKVSDTDDDFSGTFDSLRLGCITVRGETEGTDTVGVDPIAIDDDRGDPLEVSINPDCGVITCIPPSRCPTVDGTRTTDPDGDGLCEDFNGNGRMDFDDMNTFFDEFDDPEVRDNVDAFDFNENGRIDFDDINTLFDEIS